MMYNNKLVCAVKTGGKILREEQKDGNAIVTLPFGSEYSLLLKNLSGKRALVSIEIDGKKIASGGFVIKAGEEYEIERPVDSKNKFKFIEKTQEISDHRGDKIDDSLIRLTWQFEKAQVEYSYYQYTWPPKTRKRIVKRKPWPYKPWPWYEEVVEEEIIEEEVIPLRGVYYSDTSAETSSGDANSTTTISCSNASTPTISGDVPTITGKAAKGYVAGITVGGEKSSQRFGSAFIGLLENEVHSMVIQLRGIAGEKIVEQPVTVSTRTQCCSCGRSYRKNKFKFCPNDGTALED
jgi:hypothetical protein